MTRPLDPAPWRCRLVLLLALLGPGLPAQADGERYLRLGTGSPGEHQFTLGSVLAGAISAPPGLPPCVPGGICGVPGLIAVASATHGSIANLEGIIDGRLDAALVQADVAAWAAAGTPPFKGRGNDNLRAIGTLTLEQIHLVVPRDGEVHALRDLRGKRISLGEAGSGTELHARQLLTALGLKPGSVIEDNLRAAVAADAMLAGKLDGFFVMDSAPVPAVAELAKAMPIRLIAIAGPAVEKLRRANPLLTPSRIPAGTYHGITVDAPTPAVGLTLVAAATLPDDLVYGITRALWQGATQKALSEVQRDGAPVRLGNALIDLPLPLHPGAKRYYVEQGMMR